MGGCTEFHLRGVRGLGTPPPSTGPEVVEGKGPKNFLT